MIFLSSLKLHLLYLHQSIDTRSTSISYRSAKLKKREREREREISHFCKTRTTALVVAIQKARAWFTRLFSLVGERDEL